MKMNKQLRDKIEMGIQAVMNDVDNNTYTVSGLLVGNPNEVHFEVRSVFGSISFAAVMRLSTLFDTVAIDFEPYYEEGCPTCGGDYSLEFSIHRPKRGWSNKLA